MQEMNKLIAATDLQRVWAVRAIGVGAAVALLAVAAPLVWSAVTAGIGLAALAGFAALGVLVFQSIPLGMQRLENHILKLRKAEARRNPIEQLQNEMLRRAQRLKSYRGALVTVGGQIEQIEQMLAERRHQDPNYVLERQERALTRLKQFHGMNINRLVQAQAALDEFRLTVQRKEGEWRIALAIGDASAVMDPNATEQLMQDLMTDTALRTVQERFNSVFAELDVQLMSAGSPTREILETAGTGHMDALELPETMPLRSRP